METGDTRKVGCLIAALSLIVPFIALELGVLRPGLPLGLCAILGIVAGLGVSVYANAREQEAKTAQAKARVQASVAALCSIESFNVGNLQPERAPKPVTAALHTRCFFTASELVFVDGLPDAFIERTRIPINRVTKLYIEQSIFGTKKINLEWADSRGISRHASFVTAAGAKGEAALASIDSFLLSRAAPDITSVAEELQKLAELARLGVLSQQDWERAKQLYLGKPVNKREEAIKNLSQLYQLHKAGALSASEFNMKKWDILSRPG